MPIESSLVPTLLTSGAADSLSAGVQKHFGQRAERKRQLAHARHDKLYAPLVALFLNNRISSYAAVGAPGLRARCRRARQLLARREFAGALWALFDKRITMGFGMEYGRFPFAEIRRIVQDNIALADCDLIDLVASAYASQRERFDGSDLTEEEHRLGVYIMEMHARLNRSVIG